MSLRQVKSLFQSLREYLMLTARCQGQRNRSVLHMHRDKYTHNINGARIFWANVVSLNFRHNKQKRLFSQNLAVKLKQKYIL